MSERSNPPNEAFNFERVLRHGDVILFKLSDTESAGRSGERFQELILAYGEVTGHAHRLRGDLELFAPGEDISRYHGVQASDEIGAEAIPARMLFRALTATTLTHEEHDTIVLEPGMYLKVNQVEFDPFTRMIRNVQD